MTAPPIPGTILLNVGAILETISGGRYPATMHRVVVPSEEYKFVNPRQSIAFFSHPDEEVICQPLQEPNNPRYPPITARQHLEIKISSTY